jgi:hypothetical protein
MLRPITTTVGSTLAALCLVSTLAMAQSPYATQSQFPTLTFGRLLAQVQWDTTGRAPVPRFQCADSSAH